MGQWLRWLLPAPCAVTSRPQTLQVKLSEQAVIPPGIDRYAFFAALRKCCGIREIDRLCARSLRCKEREVSPCDIAEKVFRNQSRALRVR